MSLTPQASLIQSASRKHIIGNKNTPSLRHFASTQDHSLATKGCLCVWDLSSPKAPKAVLVSEGTPSCCGFAPAPASSIVFAGEPRVLDDVLFSSHAPM